MMKKFWAWFLGGMFLTLSIAQMSATERAEVDHPAPDFTLPDNSGNKHSLSDFKGKFVVLEWVNYDCPFVRKHYRSGNMPSLQKMYTKKDVVWLSICSSAPGKQGYFETDELSERMKKEKAIPTAYLLDPDGKVGKTYGAKTTPHMYIVNPEGLLIYAGGIDNIASTDIDDIEEATNYVKEVLDAAMTGKEVPVKGSRPYGCSVKYK
ncbi:MAG: thioredoxin family protein [Ignavibacteria bacterium]|nr:thioredoxin family protein [Ignavibacteria bacterium]